MKRIFLLLLLTSCLSTEVLNAPIEHVDTVQMYKRAHKPPPPPVPPSDTTDVEDTTRIPISFDVSVGDWEEEDIDL